MAALSASPNTSDTKHPATTEGPPAVLGPLRAVRVWREPEFWLVLLLVLGIYFTRPATLTIRGEESRWANVAREMLDRGDWVVPREQGAWFPNRPPLANWAIAGSMLLFGNGEALAVRFPALLATLLTALMIYTCGRVFLERFGALIAAIGYGTMGQVLQIGRHAETEPLFTLFTAGALLGWLSLYLRNRRPWITWTVGYSLAALAALTKGPQGPIYFVGSTWLFLLIFDRRYLFKRGHLLGIAVFAAIIAAWQLPFLLATDLPSAIKIWGGESANRFTQGSIWKAVSHVIAFPLEVLNCTLPWSALLLCFFDRNLRSRLGPVKKPVQFLAISTVLCILPLLMAHGARGRYFMPLYPCIALLCGAATQMAVSMELSSTARRIWRLALRASIAIPIIVTAYVVWQSTAIAAWLPTLRYPQASQSWPILFCISIAAAGVFWFCKLAIADRDTARPYRAATRAAFASAIFYGLAFTSFGINALDSYSYDTRADIRRVASLVPADDKLVSFNLISHLFAYHWANADGRRVELVETPSVAAAAQTDWDYFCFNVSAADAFVLPLPFAWEQVGVVTVDRNRYDSPRAVVIVGRKLPSSLQADGGLEGPADASPVMRTAPLEAHLPAEKRS